MGNPDQEKTDPSLSLDGDPSSSGTTVRQQSGMFSPHEHDTERIENLSERSNGDSSKTLKQSVSDFSDDAVRSDKTERMGEQEEEASSSGTIKQLVPGFPEAEPRPDQTYRSDQTLNNVSEAAHTGTIAGSMEELSQAEELASQIDSSSPEVLPVIPGYDILRELGRGGMAVVYEARQARLNRHVALKMILSRGFATQDDKLRFFTEAQVIAKLQHPNIVGVYEFGQHQGMAYLTLEFVPGGSLDRQIRGTTMPAQAAAALVEKLARAMQIAHQQGVVHRDLKPANVLMTLEGEPKISDFGLAKQETSNLTATGAVLGTPSYMAPEQARGLDIVPATDVYALGAILYELLTGRPPFKGATPIETIRQVMIFDPLPVRTLQPKVDRDLETICEKCLNKEPSKRYPSARELADDLRRFIEGRPIQARAVGPLEKTWRWCRRNPTVASLLSAIALILVVATTVATILAVWANHEKQQAQISTELAKDNLYLNQMLLVQSAWEAQDYSQARNLIAQTKDAGGRRHFEWYFQNRLLDESVKRLDGHGHDVTAVAYAPTGGMIASAGKDKTILLWDVASGAIVKKLTGHGHFITALAFTPDGKRLASASLDKTVKIWDVSTGEIIADCLGHDYSVTAVAFSPDGQQLASASLDKTIRLWESATGTPIDILHGHTGGVNAVAYRYDGKQLASAGADKSIRLWDLETGKWQKSLTGHELSVNAVAYSRDGRYLASAGDDKTIRLWETASGKTLRVMTGHAKPVSSIAISKDGEWLASAGADETVRMWNVGTGTLMRTYLGHQGAVLSIAISPDDTQIASGGSGQDHAVRLWAVGPGQTVRIVDQPRQNWNAVRYSPHGDRLAAGGRNRTVQIWDANTFELLHSCIGHTDEITSIAFSADDEFMASASADKTIRLWKAKTGEFVRAFQGHTDTVSSLVFSSDGKTLYSGSWDTTIRSWDVSTGQQTGNYQGHSHYVTSLAIARDGHLLVSSSIDKTIRLWNPASGSALAVLTGHTDPVSAVALSPDGKYLASASWDTSVRLWDVANRSAVHVFNGHTEIPRAVEFSSDGQRLFSAAEDRTVRLWDVRSRQPMRVLITTEAPCQAISIGQTDQRLGIATAGGLISLDGRPKVNEK